MSGPTLKQLRIWERRLGRAHALVMQVVEAAEKRISDPETLILIEDPLIELHVALGVVEHMIKEKLK